MVYILYALADLYHNSILTLGTGAAYGIYMGYSASYNCFYNWYNNNIVTLSAAGSYPVYLSTATVYTADYNNYYSSGTNLGYIAGARASLAAMRTYGQDSHSVKIMPDYVDMAMIYVYVKAWAWNARKNLYSLMTSNTKQGVPLPLWVLM